MVTWTINAKLDPIDPYTEDDILFQWGKYLDGANITSADVIGLNVTISSFSIINTGQDVTCRFTTGTIGLGAQITCKITTDDATPRKDKRTITIPVRSL